MSEAHINARRVSLNEFLDIVAGRVEYINGRMVAGSGIEIYVDAEQFTEEGRRLAALIESSALTR